MIVAKPWLATPLSAVASDGLFTDGDWVESKDQDANGSVRLTQLADVGVGAFRDRSRRFLREDQAAALGCTFLKPQDILIARMPDPIARACLVPADLGRAVTAVDVAILRVNQRRFNPSYVMWAINSPHFREAATALQSGTTRKRISRKNLASLHIPTPPLPTQERIAEEIAEHFSSLDAADEYRLRALQKAQVARIAIARQAFEGIDASRTLGDLLTSTIGGVWGEKPGEAAVDVDVLRVTELRKGGRLDPSTAARRSVTLTQLSKRELRQGDLLVEKSGGGPRQPVGRVGLVTELHGTSVCANFMQLMRVNQQLVDSTYLHLYLNAYHEAGGTQSLQTASTNIRNLRMPDYLKLSVPVPSLPEQRRIVQEVSQRYESFNRLTDEANRLFPRTETLRAAILSQKINGLNSNSLESL